MDHPSYMGVIGQLRDESSVVVVRVVTEFTPPRDFQQGYSWTSALSVFNFSRRNYGPDMLARIRERQLFDVSHVPPRMIEIINKRNRRHEFAGMFYDLYKDVDSVELVRQLRADWD